MADNVAYIQGATNLRVIHNNQKAIIIDTGLDRDSGHKIKRLIEQEDRELEPIINTHSHADHFGGNNYLARAP